MEGYLKGERAKLYEKFRVFIDNNPDRLWANGRKSDGHSKGGDIITIYFEKINDEMEKPFTLYEQFMSDNKLTEKDLF